MEFACKEIGENPSVGRNYTEISDRLLGFKSGKHIIFYHQISEDEIEVIRILHERMDLKNGLNG
ncbi:type II toxin-antitoxin system RelE/ParE family toxin [Fluviicola sp.]|uniref:type II toxin-antitoxin system RelE/ParE family toxin n=1 Tax=Fluviicola sp. TaxID=1917219 RepID=UPI002829DF9F|nr:type II toxin-antitoxin system RelE/ParE family toxin [Fluviicola sp.]MDR0803327.1 type II toxin-antitoxin system RelE/ParE family toxin [Fluviicola sp.]